MTSSPFDPYPSSAVVEKGDLKVIDRKWERATARVAADNN
jgi:hypothetical protein